jgi:dienelactone hydrolase
MDEALARRRRETACADYRASYRKEAAEDAWSQMIAWFKKYNVLS